jgi:hypothetical protein
MIFAVRICLRLFAGQIRAGGGKIAAVDVPSEVDDIAALAAAATVPNLFLGVDAETVIAAADRAWSRPFGLAAQMKAAAGEFVLDRHSARLLNPGVEGGGCHA